jgi:hypothetical protein
MQVGGKCTNTNKEGETLQWVARILNKNTYMASDAKVAE